jgi:ketosteroid isomerase-like protein
MNDDRSSAKPICRWVPAWQRSKAPAELSVPAAVATAVSRRDAIGLLLAGFVTGSDAGGAQMDSREMEVRTTIERYAAAWLRGDRTAIADCYHDDFTLNYFGANALSGRHAGKAAALAILGEFARRVRRKLKGVIAQMAGPERGGLVVREELASGDEAFEAERLLIYAVRDGRLSECWVYDADQARIDRLIGKN